MKDKIKRFFIKDTVKVGGEDTAEEKNDGVMEMSGFEEADTEKLAVEEAVKEVAVSEDKPITDYTLNEILEIKNKLGGEDLLCDILSEEFAVFSQSRGGDLAEKYDAFSKLKALMKQVPENIKEEAVAETEERLHSGFSGAGYRDVSNGLTKRQMDMARSAGMSFREYGELLVSAPAGRKNRF